MEKKQEGAVNLTSQVYPYTPPQEEEINLVEVWRTLVKRKKILFNTMLACVVIGSVYAIVKPEKYSFSSVLQIGLQADIKDGEVISRTPIESIDDALNKVKSAYIPLVLVQSRQSNGGDDIKREINVSSPKGSNVLILDMLCKSVDEKQCKSLIEGVSQKLIEEHALITNMTRKWLEAKLEAAENELNSSKEEAEFILAKKERLVKTSELLTSQLKDKKLLLERNLKNRGMIKSSNASGAMSVLLIDSEIQKNQTLIDELEKKLLIDSSQEKDDLEKAQKDNVRLQSSRKNDVEQLKIQILAASNTKAIVPVLKSEEPIGIKPILIVVLSVLLGLFVGLMAVFLLELTDKLKNEAKAV